MLPQRDPAQAADRSYAERWAAELFLDEAAEERGPVAYPGYQAFTPFKEEQESEGVHGPHAEEVHVADLEHGHSHEALYETPDRASQLYENQTSEDYASAWGTHSGLADHEQHVELAESEESYEGRYPATEMFEQAFFEAGEAEHFADEEEELGADEVVSGLDRAVRLNQRYGEELGWRVRYDAIARFLGFTNFGPDERTFAEAVARWQRSQGLKGDGIIGPQTWARLRGSLATDDGGRPPASPGPTSFRPTPVESPGGGRIRDKTEPDRADLVPVTGFGAKRIELHRYAAEAWRALVDAARNDGLREPLLLPVSGHRDVARQKRLWQEALDKYKSAEEARKWVAPPGGSPHHSGRAIDFYLGGKNSSGNVANLRTLPAYKWLVANAARFGFYPYEREPWHWEYNPPARPSEQEHEAQDEWEFEEPYRERPADTGEHAPPSEGERSHFDSFVREAKALLDETAEEVRRHDLDGMSEAELEATLDRYQPVESLLPQGLGQFLDGIRSAARGALTTLQTSTAGQPVSSVPGTGRAVDPERAVGANRRYGEQLGWRAHFDRIVRLLGFTSHTPDEREFATAVARWQRSQGLADDGIIGPATWARMSILLSVTLPQAPVSPPAATPGQAGTAGPAVAPGGLVLSDTGLRFIADFEGFRPNLYNDAAGHCTIGYGHLVHRGVCNGGEPEEFRRPAGITQVRALELLRADAADAARAVNRLVRVPLDQDQFDALVSFTFNVGEGALRDSTLLRELNAGRYDAVPAQLNRWTRAGGRILSGLVRRRAAEGALFSRGGLPASGAGATQPTAPGPPPATAPQGQATTRPAVAGSTEDLQALLRFLRVTSADFAPFEARYFEVLRGLLLRRGAIGANEVINRSTFRDAMRRFQRANNLGDDGIPGEDTLWALQVDWANGRNIGLRRVDADLWVRPPRTLASHNPDQDGYNHFNLREDAVPRYLDLRRAMRDAGAMITSAGSFRPINAAVTTGRSATSFHYSGLAFDLATTSGMRDPTVDPYIITSEGDLWRVWARTDQGLEQRLDAVVWENGATRTQTVTARVLDFTALAVRHGLRRIRRRSEFPRDYRSAEWWHFQCEELLVPWISQFGIELLSLQRYTQANLQAVPGIWNNRKKIFKRGGREGWH